MSICRGFGCLRGEERGKRRKMKEEEEGKRGRRKEEEKEK